VAPNANGVGYGQTSPKKTLDLQEERLRLPVFADINLVRSTVLPDTPRSDGSNVSERFGLIVENA
jgi:hypothetical protein